MIAEKEARCAPPSFALTIFARRVRSFAAEMVVLEKEDWPDNNAQKHLWHEDGLNEIDGDEW